MVLMGWPARSASVALLEAGSGTDVGVSLFHRFVSIKYKQFEPCRLCPRKVGGGMALRELCAEALNSVSCF